MAAGALALAACTALPPSLPEDPARELSAVPFFPQTIHQCGPAALATVLGWSGVAVTPEALAPQVYIPGREGSLAVELAAAARRAGRVPWVLAPDFTALQAELAADTPVLVLQDLGLAGWQAWHFAVVIGFDAGREFVVLRSGTERRRIERWHRFEASWERGGRWALVTLPPGRLPASLPPAEVVRQLEEARGVVPAGAPAATYAAALARWPSDPTVLFAAANDAYGSGSPDVAEARYRQLLALEPTAVAARNNLANLLLDRGCADAARAEAARALADLGQDPDHHGRYRAAIEDTFARASAAPPRGCRPW
ncbi:MAG: PA2778 family cysteine peptidase [Gammaproteobacteria bacterium]|nr:PA2778 family cysteine peptidase [Gammaproteobacteria bacterium]